MSNIVADFDSQEESAVEENVEISNVDENTITDSTEDTISDITEEVLVEDTQAETEVVEPSIPSKFAGKSQQEIIDSYTNLEKELGRKAQEVGELRKLSDSFLQAEVARTNNPQNNTPLETEDNAEIDFFDNPNKAVNEMIEKHPRFQEFQQFQAQQAQAGAKAQLEQKHPDFTDVVQDKGFQEWVQDSPIRMQMFQAADSYNFDAANELLSNWKDRSMISKTQEVKQQAETNRKDALKAGSTESRSSSASSAGGKTYRRADLIRLKMENPSRYESLEDDIFAAYADGRVV